VLAVISRIVGTAVKVSLGAIPIILPQQMTIVLDSLSEGEE
jgi:hypothetical protein